MELHVACRAVRHPLPIGHEVLMVPSGIQSSDVICMPLLAHPCLCFTVDGIINVLYSTGDECRTFLGVYITLLQKERCH